MTKLSYISGRRMGDGGGGVPTMPSVTINVNANNYGIYAQEGVPFTADELERTAAALSEWIYHDQTIYYKLTMSRYFIEKMKERGPMLTSPEAIEAFTIYQAVSAKYNARQAWLRANCIEYETGYNSEWAGYADRPFIGFVVWIIIAVAVVACVFIFVTQDTKVKLHQASTESNSDSAQMDKVLTFIEKHPELAGQALPLVKSMIETVSTPASKSTFGEITELIQWGVGGFVVYKLIEFFTAKKNPL